MGARERPPTGARAGRRARVLVQRDRPEDAVRTRATDEPLMQRAIRPAAGPRPRTSPNPWVGCVVAAADGSTFAGATEPPGGPRAEVVALRAAGDAARGATLVTTLEPCSHHGRTPPCV